MKQLLFILFTFCVISNTYASDACLHRPGCEELGYIQTRKQCECFNKDVLPCPFNIKDDNTVFCGDLDCTDKCKDLLPFYDGQSNTKKIIEQAGEKGLAAYATSLFYVGDKNGDFGQGKWYLPSIGEWMDFYGTDMEKITELQWANGSVGDKMKLIESALKALAVKGVDAEILNNVQFNHYISSSMYSNAMNWKIDFKNGSRSRGYFHQPSGGGGKVRAALMIRNCFNPTIGGIPPKVGDVMYQDKTYGAVSEYEGSKTPVGVVVSVSETGRDVIILNLKDLTFNSQTEVNNFNPDNPYGETINVIAWGVQTVALTFGTDDFVTDLQSSCNCNCQFYKEENSSCNLTVETCVIEGKIFNAAACACEACPNGYVFENGVCVVDPCAEKCTTAYPLFAGQDNTKAAIEQIGNKALAAYAASQFYVGDKNGDFGQGKWYLPSIGEWMYAYGTNVAQMKNGDGETGAEGNNNALINDALSTLLDKGIEADVLKSRYYLSSSETGPYNSWIIYGSSGYRAYRGKSTNNYALRCSLLLKDCFNPSAGGTAPIIGDVMYSDKTYDSAADYNGSKIPVGIVSSVSKDGSDVTIINLKDLTFSSYNTVGNFDPNAPYGYDETTTFWCTVDKRTEDISKIQNFDSIQLFTAAQASDNCPCQFYPPE